MFTLVTGANGFVGTAIARRVLETGQQLRCLVRPEETATSPLRQLGSPDELEIVGADITDRDAVDAACADIDRVFHAAAMVHASQPLEEYRRVNVEGTRNVAEAAFLRGIDRFVHISTSDVFGLPDAGETFTETSPLRGWGEPYPDSKIEAETWLWRFHRERGLPLSVVYPGWVYGPGDKAFFPALADSIRDGSMSFWCRDCWLPWVHVDNLADACLLIARHPDALGQGFLAYDDDRGPTLQEVCGKIAEAIGCPPPKRHIPYTLAFLVAWMSQKLRSEPTLRTVDVKAFGYVWRFSNRKLRALGWHPTIPVEEGIDQAIQALFAESPRPSKA